MTELIASHSIEMKGDNLIHVDPVTNIYPQTVPPTDINKVLSRLTMQGITCSSALEPSLL